MSSNERITDSFNTLPYVSDNRLRAPTSPSLHLSFSLSVTASTLFSETSLSLSLPRIGTLSLSYETRNSTGHISSDLRRKSRGSPVSSRSGHHFEFHRCSTDGASGVSRAHARLASLRLLSERERQRKVILSVGRKSFSDRSWIESIPRRPIRAIISFSLPISLSPLPFFYRVAPRSSENG